MTRTKRRAPRPEGMSDQRLDAIKSYVERSLWGACQCQIPSCIYCQRNDLLAEVSRLRADGATLRELVEAALTDEALPRLLEHAPMHEPIRTWAPRIRAAIVKAILASAPKEPTLKALENTKT